MLEGDGLFGTGGKTGKAADTVGMAHEGLVGDIDIHWANLGAKVAVNTGGIIAADANEAQHTQKAAARTAHAGIVAEGALEEETHKEKGDQHA